MSRRKRRPTATQPSPPLPPARPPATMAQKMRLAAALLATAAWFAILITLAVKA